jgi:hypothetical protein
MRRAAQRRERDPMAPGLVDRRLHRLLADDLAVAEMTVEDREVSVSRITSALWFSAMVPSRT